MQSTEEALETKGNALGESMCDISATGAACAYRQPEQNKEQQMKQNNFEQIYQAGIHQNAGFLPTVRYLNDESYPHHQ